MGDTEIKNSSNQQIKQPRIQIQNGSNSKNLIGHTSFESQSRNYIPCFGHICIHPHGQVNIHKYGLNHGIISYHQNEWAAIATSFVLAQGVSLGDLEKWHIKI